MWALESSGLELDSQEAARTAAPDALAHAASVPLCLRPCRPPAQGVRVRASPLFIPELTQVAEDEEPQYFFAYR